MEERNGTKYLRVLPMLLKNERFEELRIAHKSPFGKGSAFSQLFEERALSDQKSQSASLLIIGHYINCLRIDQERDVIKLSNECKKTLRSEPNQNNEWWDNVIYRLVEIDTSDEGNSRDNDRSDSNTMVSRTESHGSV